MSAGKKIRQSSGRDSYVVRCGSLHLAFCGTLINSLSASGNVDRKQAEEKTDD